jgi:hypothetical protein
MIGHGRMTSIFVCLWTLVSCLPGLPQPAGASAPPYPPSPAIEGITWDFAHLRRLASGSDLWPVTWAADGHLYTSWGDGGGFGGTNTVGRVSLGFARIEGGPRDFVGVNIWGGKDAKSRAQFPGKCYSMLAVDGILYGWLWQPGGKLELAFSRDRSQTWQRVVDLRFPEDGFGPVSFLNFGKDYVGARDQYVYIYGSEESGQSLSLARVPKNRITDRSAYEFWLGVDREGIPLWTLDITQREPVFVDRNGVDSAAVIFHPGIRRYLLTAAHRLSGQAIGGVGQLGIFDSVEPWGPWTTITYEDNWGGFGKGEALGYHLPTKWISLNDRTLWMIFSSTGELDAFNLIEATLTFRFGEKPK